MTVVKFLTFPVNHQSFQVPSIYAIWFLELVCTTTGKRFRQFTSYVRFTPCQGILHTAIPRATGSIPVQRLVQGDLSREVKNELGARHNAGVCKKAVNHWFFLAQQRLQILELQFDEFTHFSHHFRCKDSKPRPRLSLISEERKKATLHSTSDELVLRADPQESPRKWSLWWTPGQACTWSAGQTWTLPNCL